MCLIWQHLVVTVQAADVSVATSTVVLVKIEERPVFLLSVLGYCGTTLLPSLYK